MQFKILVNVFSIFDFHDKMQEFVGAYFLIYDCRSKLAQMQKLIFSTSYLCTKPIFYAILRCIAKQNHRLTIKCSNKNITQCHFI